MNKRLSKGEVLSLGLMLFSIFFGAGNLIFPPALGQAAGTDLLPAMAGFLITGVGLPLMGVLAIGLAGGSYIKLMSEKVHPKFTVALLVVLNLTIGPLFAIPRTGAVSFEVGIRSFTGDAYSGLAQFAYTLLFFGVTYFLALNPNKIVDRVGKILTPVLLFFMAILFIQVFINPLGSFGQPVGQYVNEPFFKGFQEGYLTMDLLAFIAIGAIVINSIKNKGITAPHQVGKLCIIAGIISAVLMSLVYVCLAYLGATSASTLGQSENGGIILSSVANIYFSHTGSIILAVIISFACLTTSCGLASSCAWYFNKLSNGKLKYNHLLLAIIAFSMAAANIGLTGLINISVPFLVALYPVIIVLVILSLINPFFTLSNSVYRWSLGLTLAFSIFDGLNAANIKIGFINTLFSQYIPFYAVNLGWIMPALVGIMIGWLLSKATKSINF